MHHRTFVRGKVSTLLIGFEEKLQDKTDGKGKIEMKRFGE